MADADLKSRAETAPELAPAATWSRAPETSPRSRRRFRVLPVVFTLIAVALAVVFGDAMWRTYMVAPWTRDGTVRAYVVTMAPQVAGQIVQLPVFDNQFVHKGDLLLVIDPTDYKIAVQLAEAAVEHAQVTAQNAMREAQRRQELTQLAVTKEEKQTFESDAVADQATYQQAVANLNQARVNLQRTEIRSPVNGYVTNLLAQLGDYATVGENLISLVDADSFWVDGYFEETNLDRVHVGDPAKVKLMGYRRIIRGHVVASPAASASPTRSPTAKDWRRLIRYSPGCASHSASRYASTLITSPRVWCLRRERPPRSKFNRDKARRTKRRFGSAYPVTKRLLVGDKAVDLPIMDEPAADGPPPLRCGRRPGRTRQAAALRLIARRASTSATVWSTIGWRMPNCAPIICTSRSVRSILAAPLNKARAAEDGRTRSRAAAAYFSNGTKSLGDAPIFSDTSHTQS